MKIYRKLTTARGKGIKFKKLLLLSNLFVLYLAYFQLSNMLLLLLLQENIQVPSVHSVTEKSNHDTYVLPFAVYQCHIILTSSRIINFPTSLDRVLSSWSCDLYNITQASGLYSLLVLKPTRDPYAWIDILNQNNNETEPEKLRRYKFLSPGRDELWDTLDWNGTATHINHQWSISASSDPVGPMTDINLPLFIA
jgi:hypothetical protein